MGHLRVIGPPGYAPGHLASLEGRDGTLYTGDAVVNVLGLRGSRNCLSCSRCPRWAPQALESAWRLLSRPKVALTRAVERSEYALARPPSPLRLAVARRVNALFGAAGKRSS